MVVWLRVNIFRLCVCVCRGCGASPASTASAGALGRRLHGCVAPLSLCVPRACVCVREYHVCLCVRLFPSLPREFGGSGATGTNTVLVHVVAAYARRAMYS